MSNGDSSEENSGDGKECEIDILFGLATETVAHLVAGKDLKDETALEFYGLYKQATVGQCTSGRPLFFEVTNRAKW